MDHLLTVAFEAHHAEKNHHRRYQVTVGRDLLDDWTVAISYGRTGQAGRELQYAASEADAMRAIIGPADHPDLADLYPGHGHSARVE